MKKLDKNQKIGIISLAIFVVFLIGFSALSSLRTFFAFLPTLTHRLRGSLQQKEPLFFDKGSFLSKPQAWYIIRREAVSHHA